MKPGKKAEEKSKEELRDVILKSIVEENEMFDDHGPVIIGMRGDKPILPKEKKKEDE